MSRNVRRLFEQFEPESYDLVIKPDKTKMVFEGSVVIRGRKSGRPSKRLVFHAKGLKVSSATVTSKSRTNEQKEVKLSRIITHAGYDELRLHSADLLYPGEYRIEIKFSGTITRQMEGLYPCFYESDSGQEIILATQFESHHAREVFPCIDEPEAKAVFNLSLLLPEVASDSEQVVLANTNLKAKSKTSDGLISYDFEPTPKMSTYLLAFVIGKMSFLEAETKAGVKVRTYARPSQVAFTAFALETAVRCLDFYNDYFDISYPLAKCDLVALPDFASGAMENWGLITFREQGLIVDPANTSLNMKQYVANVIAHELTHQWFGNLVTMRWWNDLWLNESFASLMSYVALDALFPAWQIWVQFSVDEQAPALKLDSLESTHPISVKIRHPDEIRTIFDNISYEKGASVLFMLMQYIGETAFRDGLRLYLKKHKYANTESADLWQAWDSVTAIKVADFMDAWTKQEGYPLLRAKLTKDTLSLAQSRFYLSNEAAQKQTDETLWPLPLLPSLNLPQPLLKQAEREFKLASQNDFVLNHGRSAFYRVIYDKDHLKRLEDSIKRKQLSELDRLGLLADVFEAAKAGLVDTIEALELLDAYAQEDSEVVWETMAANIGAVRSIIIDEDEETRKLMNPKVHALIREQYARLGWEQKEDDSHFDILLRPVILGLGCMSDLNDALAQAKERFYQRASKSISPDIRAVIYPTIARYGGKEEYELLLKMHHGCDNSEERLSLTAALTDFKQPELIERSLKLITTKEVRLQDVAYWISYAFSNRYAKSATWDWLKQNWDWLKQNLGTDLSFFMMPRYVARAYSDLSFIPEFEKFFRDRMSVAYERPLSQAIETITWQGLWKQREQDKLKAYYKQLNNLTK